MDDDAQVCSGLGRLLVVRGHAVTAALSCTAARNLGGTYDVGIVDLHMSDGTGDHLANLLLKRQVVRRVVFYSGSTDGELVQRAARHGVVVAKADSMDRLLEAVGV